MVDPMGKYRDIAAVWGGQYINLTLSAKNVFYMNLFHVPDVVQDTKTSGIFDNSGHEGLYSLVLREK